jgi:CubicO group peptidase (beta-lactamase class C family)
VEKRIKATPHTLYHLGSLGKVYTATAIMILKERGLIDLDKQANEYLGKAKIEAYEGNINDVTLRRILNHTSGLSYMWTHLYAPELNQRPPWDEVIRRFGKTVSPPGERYIYSNFGFSDTLSSEFPGNHIMSL